MSSETGCLLCGGGFGLSLIVWGIWMIVTKKGNKILSKNQEKVEGPEAVNQGSLALLIGIVILGISIWINLQK